MRNLALALWLYGAWPAWWKIVADNRRRLHFRSGEVLAPRRAKKMEFAEIVRPLLWPENPVPAVPFSSGSPDGTAQRWRRGD